MNDPTESIRRSDIAKINTAVENSDEDVERSRLEAKYGQAWDTTELQQDFEVIGFMAPLVAVMRKEDKVKGSLEFQASPRFYFNFQKH